MRLGKLAIFLAAAMAFAPVAAGAQGRPIRILFVGNSFTQGAHSAVRNYRAGTVTDLNRAGYGGVPALFKLFTREVGLNYDVSLETQGGKGLGFHYETRKPLLDRAWDVVMLQDLSELDRDNPGDPAPMVRYAGLLASMFHARNPAVKVNLTATWSRADLTYKPKGHWYGRPIGAMAADIRAAADLARARSHQIAAVVPVGEAWTRAMEERVADPDPYDGTSFGQVNLWTYDQYHGSIYGYYLEALVIFGTVTGRDPRALGEKEQAADELGLSAAETVALQRVAFEQLEAEKRR